MRPNQSEPLEPDWDDEPSRSRRRATPASRNWWSRQSVAVRVLIAITGIGVFASCPLSAVYFAARYVRSERANDLVAQKEASTSWQRGAVKVDVIEAAVLDDEFLYIFVTVRTSDDRSRINFTGWRRLGFGSASMRDDAGNGYAQKAVDLLIDGGLEMAWNQNPQSKSLKYGPGSVTSDQGRVEVLIFPKPPPGISYVDLELAGRSVGERDDIRLRIPSSMWRDRDTGGKSSGSKGKR